jgi:hypothetical protein
MYKPTFFMKSSKKHPVLLEKVGVYTDGDFVSINGKKRGTHSFKKL